MHDEDIGQPPQLHRLRRTHVFFAAGAVPPVVVVQMFRSYKVFEAGVECLAAAVVAAAVRGGWFGIGRMGGGLDEGYRGRRGGGRVLMISSSSVVTVTVVVVPPFEFEEEEGFGTVGSEDGR